MRNMKKLAAWMLAAAMGSAMIAVPVFAESETEIETEAVEVEDVATVVTEIQKYGNMVLEIEGSKMQALGYEYGDLVDVTVNGETYTMAVGSNYSDVDQGSMICRVVNDGTDDYTLIAINMGDLATTAGVATKAKIEADPGYEWTLNDGVEDPVFVTITMNEKGGYYDQYMIHQLAWTTEREDYENLSDEEYGNFRMIETTGVGKGILYRSSSPVNPSIARNSYVDAAVEAAQIKTVMNLADNDETMQAYEGYADTYYSTLNIIGLNLAVDFQGDEFRAGIADGFRFIAENEGPYLVHCNEGKDRAGFTSAVLEAFMGASAQEIIDDYMVTFYNYYGVEEGTETYDAIVNSNIKKSLATAFDVEDIEDENVDLAAEAAEYMAEIGLSEEEIQGLHDALSVDVEE